MKYIKEYAFSALAILMASCSSDSDTIEPEAQKTPVASSGTMSFSASIESGEAATKATRTSLADANTDSPYPIWSSNDQIKVFNTTTEDARLFTINSSDVGKRAANFTGEIKVETGNNANNKFYAFYAGNVGASKGAPTISMSGSNVTVSGTIPSVQSSTPAFNPNLHFMTACTTGSAFSFKNGMALMKVTISDNNYENFKITKIILKSNNPDEKIAGDFTATIGDNGTLSNYSVTNGSSKIVIDNGTSALATGTYYIAINPCDFSSGFTLSFHENSADGNLKQYDRVKDASFPVAASEIINLGSYTGKECAKEAYVDLGLTNSSGQKVMWCVENVYDEGGESNNETISSTKETSPNSSYYAWGETYVKANQKKYNDNFRTYSWYFDYSIGQGSDAKEAIIYRSYKHGLGSANYNGFTASESYNFLHEGWILSYQGVLINYNSSSDYTRSFADWRGGQIDGKKELEVADDAAYQKSPRHIVRIPTALECGALYKLKSTTTSSSVKFENPTTHHYITLPVGGFIHKKSSSDDNEPKNTTVGAYWTRDRGSSDADSYKAQSFIPTAASSPGYGLIDRCQGRMIRGVIYK